MRSIFVIYLPGHAGNFVSRTFSLSPETMPLLKQQQIKHYVSNQKSVPNFSRLSWYKFSTVLSQHQTWQQFHRAWADYKDYAAYRLINLYSKQVYQTVIYQIHPREMISDYVSIEPEDFFHIELDLQRWGHWVRQEQQRLQFVQRPDEGQQFEQLKIKFKTKPIDLNKMLDNNDNFVEEYLRVCNLMKLTPVVDQALSLRKDWYDTRVKSYE